MPGQALTCLYLPDIFLDNLKGTKMNDLLIFKGAQKSFLQIEYIKVQDGDKNFFV